MARQITGGVCEAVKRVKFSVWCGGALAEPCAIMLWRCAGVVFLYHLCPAPRMCEIAHEIHPFDVQ